MTFTDDGEYPASAQGQRILGCGMELAGKRGRHKDFCLTQSKSLIDPGDANGI